MFEMVNDFAKNFAISTKFLELMKISLNIFLNI